MRKFANRKKIFFEFCIIFGCFILPNFFFINRFEMFPKITVNIYALANPVNLVYNLARLVLPLVFFIDYGKKTDAGKTLQMQDENPHNVISRKFPGKTFYKNCIFTFSCLAILLLSGLVFEYVGSFFGGETEIEPGKIPVTTLFAFFVPVIFYAASEEVLYRLYLPESLNKFFSRIKLFKREESFIGEKISRKAPQEAEWNLPGEILSVLIFALAHYQGGILPVLNALVCGTILRICLKMSKSLFPCILSHGLYNFILYFSLYSQP